MTTNEKRSIDLRHNLIDSGHIVPSLALASKSDLKVRLTRLTNLLDWALSGEGESDQLDFYGDCYTYSDVWTGRPESAVFAWKGEIAAIEGLLAA